MASFSPYKRPRTVHILVSHPSQLNHVAIGDDGTFYLICVSENAKSNAKRLKPQTSHKLRGYELVKNNLIIDKSSEVGHQATADH